MQGVGRGRGAVLPAWMSKAQGASPAAAAPGSELGKRSWEPEEFGDGARPTATKSARTEPTNTTPIDNSSVKVNTQTPETLPEGWSSALDPTYNQYYYFNAATGERSWTKPSLEQHLLEQPETVTKLEPSPVVEPKEVEPEIAAEEWQQPGAAEQEQQIHEAAAIAPTTAVSDILPDGWASAFDPQHQRSYFYNLTTGQRTWIKPEAPLAVVAPSTEQQEQQFAAEQPAEVASSLPPGWGQATDEATGCIYYYNEAGDVQWYPPVVLPQQRIAGQGDENPKLPQQQPSVPGAAVQQTTNQTRAPVPQQQTPSSYNSSSFNRGGGRGALYQGRGRDQGGGTGGRGGTGERGRGRGRGRGRTDQQNRAAEFDPMDPSAYSDTPRGGWGAGLESAARGGG